MTIHELSCDILIAGGGPAGVPCALAAARNGAKVILCQDRSMLGGNASSEVRMHIVGANGFRPGKDLETETRESGIIEEIRLETCVNNPQRCSSMLDLVLYDLCRKESNLTLLLDTSVNGALKTGNLITHAIAVRQNTEDQFGISAKIFIDCTGDGRLGAEAGAKYRMGREGRDEYNESLAEPAGDGCTLGSTILFEARRHPHPMPFVAPSWARKFAEEDLLLRPHATEGVDNGLEYGYWWVEWGGHLNTIKDNPHIRDELLAIVMGVWDHIKNGGAHGAENWALDWFGFLPAKRESRRFIGQYTLTENDLMQSKQFDDAIAFGGWPIDTHPPRGIDAINEEPCCQTPVPKLFDIPLRACVSTNIHNLMFAGRNISATHIAFASTRVMATCAVVGQGVGTAAAHAVQANISPANLSSDASAIQTIQLMLLKDDAYLIGKSCDDPKNLALQAKITASTQQSHGAACQVISTQNRSVHGQRGAPEDRAHPGSHRWMSDPNADLPAYLELQWPATVGISEIILVFDTGLHRILTLSHSDDYVKKMIWGKPQPETVRDYQLQQEINGEWKTIVDVKNNYQRLRKHKLPEEIRTRRLRLRISATNGLDHARIMSVRVY